MTSIRKKNCCYLSLPANYIGNLDVGSLEELYASTKIPDAVDLFFGNPDWYFNDMEVAIQHAEEANKQLTEIIISERPPKEVYQAYLQGIRSDSSYLIVEFDIDVDEIKNLLNTLSFNKSSNKTNMSLIHQPEFMQHITNVYNDKYQTQFIPHASNLRTRSSL